MRSFLNELHKNKRIKVRLSIAFLFLLFLFDFSSIGYLVYVLLTEYFRYFSRKGMPFFNSLYFKFITMGCISLLLSLLTGERHTFAYIIAHIIIAFMIELPVKFVIAVRSLFEQNKKWEEKENMGHRKERDYQDVHETKFTRTTRTSRSSCGTRYYRRSHNSSNIHMKDVEYQDITDEKQNHETPPEKQKYKISRCDSCGSKNKILCGEVTQCEYCGTAID